MEKEAFIKNGFDMIYLSACALHSVVPSAERIEKMDLLEVYRISAKHLMQSITYIALESFLSQNPEYKSKISKELLNEWKFMKSKAVRNLVLFDEERNKLAQFLEDNDIWYAYLKGIVIQKYYPKLGMRQMCDNDILFDPTKRKEVYDYMTSCGYDVISYDNGYPDAYKKSPSVLFEMHQSLYTESELETVFNNYYSDVKSVLVKDDDNNYGYHFSKEDYYIHTMTHVYKHFAKAGSGIRSLMDSYVFMRGEGDYLDLDYISKELKELDIYDFESDLRNLGKKLFSKEIINSADYGKLLDEEEKDLYLFYLTSGTFGNKINCIKNKVKRGIGDKKYGVVKYIFRRFFPNKIFYKMNYPKLYKYKVLIPFIAIYRIVTRSIVNFKELKYEFKIIIKNKK